MTTMMMNIGSRPRVMVNVDSIAPRLRQTLLKRAFEGGPVSTEIAGSGDIVTMMWLVVFMLVAMIVAMAPPHSVHSR